MPYAERLAESYLAAKEAERNNGTAGEDPLFKQIAGDSKEFVGGIPKETWDGMGDKEKDEQVRGTEADRQHASWAGAGIGAVVGTGVGTAAGVATGGILGPYPTAIGSAVGGAMGYDLAKEHFENRQAPPTINRNDLYRQFKDTIGRE